MGAEDTLEEGTGSWWRMGSYSIGILLLDFLNCCCDCGGGGGDENWCDERWNWRWKCTKLGWRHGFDSPKLPEPPPHRWRRCDSQFWPLTRMQTRNVWDQNHPTWGSIGSRWDSWSASGFHELEMVKSREGKIDPESNGKYLVAQFNLHIIINIITT